MRTRERPAGRWGATAIAAILGSVLVLPAAGLAATSGTPPPTPVPVPGGGMSPSPFPTVLHTPPPSAGRPVVRAGSAVLADLDSGQVLWAKDPDRRRPIASLTKIMTALLVLQRASPSDVVTVSPGAAAPDRTPGVSELGLNAGERISVGNLLYALLLQSANDAAEALAIQVSGSVPAFVDELNARARALHLVHTRFASPNGLDDTGYSSAGDVARMTSAAFRRPPFPTIVAARFHRIPSPAGEARIIQNRNVMLWLYPGAIGVKTGYTRAAGFCVVAAAARDGVRLVAVVLGEPGEPFSDAAELLNYGFRAFERRDVVREGASFGAVSIQGRHVGVSAGAGLSGLVPVDAEVVRRLTLRSGVTFPPANGETVGSIEVSAGDLRLGRLPLVVTGVPGPPPPGPGPWWRRAGSAMASAVSSAVSALFG